MGGIFPALLTPGVSLWTVTHSPGSRAKTSSSGCQAEQCPRCGVNEGGTAAAAGELETGTSWVRLERSRAGWEQACAISRCTAAISEQGVIQPKPSRRWLLGLAKQLGGSNRVR